MMGEVRGKCRVLLGIVNEPRTLLFFDFLMFFSFLRCCSGSLCAGGQAHKSRDYIVTRDQPT
jgi:hypothetical protein